MEEDVQQSIAEFLAELPLHFGQVIQTVIIILVLILIHLLAKRIVRRQTSNEELRYKWRKNLAYTLSFFGFIIIGRIWFEGVGSLATFLGLLSAGLAIALRGPVTDMAGWLFLLWRKPFDVGDRIQIGQDKGDVIDIRFFKFSVLEIGNWVHADQSTGRVVHIPNHRVFSESVMNYTSDFDFIWNEIAVIITFESNWKKAKSILNEIAQGHMEDYVHDAEEQVRRATQSYLIRYRNLTPIVYTEVVDIGIKLTIRHLSHARKRRGLNQMMWEDILERFGREEDLDFAYQTVRIYQNQIEGKPPLRP